MSPHRSLGEPRFGRDAGKRLTLETQLDDVTDTIFWTPQSAGGTGLGRVLRIVLEARARAGGQVDQDVGPARADALDHLAIESTVHARLGGLRVANVDVDDGGAGLGSLDR